jgi:hypothetical protein
LEFRKEATMFGSSLEEWEYYNPFDGTKPISAFRWGQLISTDSSGEILNILKYYRNKACVYLEHCGD